MMVLPVAKKIDQANTTSFAGRKRRRRVVSQNRPQHLMPDAAELKPAPAFLSKLRCTRACSTDPAPSDAFLSFAIIFAQAQLGSTHPVALTEL